MYNVKNAPFGGYNAFKRQYFASEIVKVLKNCTMLMVSIKQNKVVSLFKMCFLSLFQYNLRMHALILIDIRKSYMGHTCPGSNFCGQMCNLCFIV